MRKKIESKTNIFSVEKNRTRANNAPINFKGVFKSLLFGIITFLIILVFIVLSKAISYSFGVKENLILETQDYIISLWGFLIISFTVFAKNNAISKSL